MPDVLLRYKKGYGPLPNFWGVAIFLWGEGVDYDSDGDCAHADDRNWTCLTLAERRIGGDRISIDLVDDIYQISSTRRDLAESILLFLMEWTGGSWLDEAGRPLPIDDLRDRLLAGTPFVERWERAVAWHSTLPKQGK